MDSTPEHAVNYLDVIDCSLDAAKQNEELQDRPPKQQEKAYLGLPIDIYTKITPRDYK